MTVLLWGPPEDEPLRDVRASLAALGAEVFFLDQHRTLEAEIELAGAGELGGRLSVDGAALDLGATRSAYIRPGDASRLLARRTAGRDDALRRIRAFESLLIAWSDISAARVINRPAAMASNGSKPYQTGLIRRFGLETPATLVTTDPAAAQAFWDRHGAVVYKSVSGVRSIVSRLTPAHRPRLEDVAACPTQFQEHVPGTDVRIHVVGDALFGCEITSRADDYRYGHLSGEIPIFRPWTPEPDIAARCVTLTRELGLEISGIDLRRRPDGRWCCFEVNPSPGFSYYEHATGHPIAEAIARRLLLEC